MNGSDIRSVYGVRIALGLFLAGLLFLGYQVLHVFIVPVAWAVILTYVSWPLNQRMRALLGRHVNTSALLMTLLLAGAFAVPVVWVVAMLRAEVASVYPAVVGYLGRGPGALPPYIAKIPWLGSEIEHLLRLAVDDPTALRAHVLDLVKPWADQTLGVLEDLGRTVFKFLFALLTAFFLYRDGEPLQKQWRQLFLGLLGPRALGYLQAIAGTTRAVLYGLIVTALIQGAVAGVGYWGAGVEAPVLLGVVTVIAALVPFGAPVVWGLISIWLIAVGHVVAGIGLALWGTVVVSQIDNLFRPLMISNATRIPFLLVLFGVLGGLSAFGLIGLFVGPIVIAVLLAVWHEWMAGHHQEGETGVAILTEKLQRLDDGE